MAPRKTILAKELKVGDVMHFSEQWTVLDTFAAPRGTRINIKARTSHGTHYTFFFYPLDPVLVSAPKRTCAPCYDSDCDCVFDGVDNA